MVCVKWDDWVCPVSWSLGCFRHGSQCNHPAGLPGAAIFAVSLVGALVGLGVFTPDYGEGLSYFSTDPAACANCLMCHQSMTADMLVGAGHDGAVRCVHCHVTVGHGEKAGLGGPQERNE